MTTTEQMLTQMAEDEDRKIAEAWPIYWKLLERIESGVELNATARQELMEAAKLLNRKEKMSRDAGRVRDMLNARSTLAKTTPEFLEKEKRWIETEMARLHARLLAFQKEQTPLAIAFNTRQTGWEQSRGDRGRAEGEIERFKSFISAGPDSEMAQY